MEKAIGRYHSATECLAEKYHRNVIKINQTMHEYNNNLKKFAYATNSAIYKKSANPYDGYDQKNLFRKKSNNHVVNKNKNYPNIRVNVGKLQNNEWFRSKVYQR
jgi:hypothetical protein